MLSNIGTIGNVDRKVVLLTGAALIAVSIVAKYVASQRERRRKQQSRNEIPVQWRRVGCLEELIVYPLKSGRAITMQQAECTEIGVRTINDDNTLRLRDRTFVVYDEQSKTSRTALQQPKMILITVTAIGKDQVRFSAPHTTDLLLTLPGPDTVAENSTYCSLWLNEKADTVDCGEEAAVWMSQYISGKPSGLRLGYSVTCEATRNVAKAPWTDFKKVYKNMRNEDYGIYSDLASFMLLGSNSIEDLNSRLPSHSKKTKAGNFRPNFVVQGSPAYDEDTWDWVRIGDTAVFRAVKPCTRCTFTTIDTETAIMDRQFKEPLTTLKTYRKLTKPNEVALDGDSPVMGLYLGLHTPGLVHTGDSVYVGEHAS